MFEIVKAMISKVFGGSSSKAIADAVLIDPLSQEFKDVWSGVTATYDTIIVPVGVCILIFLFFYAIVEKASSENVSFETIGNMIVQLLLLCGFMEVAMYLASLILHTTYLVVQAVNTNLSSIPTDSEVVSEVVKLFFFTEEPVWTGTFSFLTEFRECFAPFFILSVPWLITVACELIIELYAFMRQIEVFVRATFFPVAIGDCYGSNPSGVRYVKTFLALCLQGAVIIVTIRICDILCLHYIRNVDVPSIADFSSVMAVVIMPIVYHVAATALVLKSLPLCKEICGAN